MKISELQLRAYMHAVNKGFWADAKDALEETRENYDAVLAAFVGLKIALAHSELSEALEEIRADNWEPDYEPGEKPIGLASELADTVIRVADICGFLQIDLEAVITEKLEYNARARGHKHGKKF